MSAKPFGFVFLKIATCLCLWCDVPIIEKGRIKGILTSKGEAWVEVKDDLGYAHRYLAPWSGKIGAYNGSFNSEIINQINELIVGNRGYFETKIIVFQSGFGKSNERNEGKNKGQIFHICTLIS